MTIPLNVLLLFTCGSLSVIQHDFQFCVFMPALSCKDLPYRADSGQILTKSKTAT